MALNTGLPAAAIGLRGIADSASSTVIAFLLLVALVVLGYGLVRAIVASRRAQIVVADLIVPDNAGDLAQAVLLSSVARQMVGRQVLDQRDETARVGRMILAAASPELEPQLDEGALDHIQRVADDSIATLAAALRAVSPETADRFLGLFAAVLPPPRGLSVTMAVLTRGSVAAPRLGVAVDLIRLDGRALASAMFWEPASQPAAMPAPGEGAVDRLLTLLDPVTRWIAVRLVVTALASAQRGATSQLRQGLQRMLTGGLFLQAMRDFPLHALAFGEQASDELAQARLLMPGLPLPVTTHAGVLERMGWAHRLAGAPAGAAQADFRQAARLWQEAEKLTRDNPGPDSETKLALLTDRRLKAQFAGQDHAMQAAALAELASVSRPAALLGNRTWLYNRACLYAQASLADPDAGYQQQALYWLGLALTHDRNASLWDYAPSDPELDPVGATMRPFLDRLRELIPADVVRCGESEAKTLVSRALAMMEA